ncbi:hypothetical protein M0804_004312 [Polistes exclamans]|nr:hypothetical protein M0804_004312 [Polistes exclamans]
MVPVSMPGVPAYRALHLIPTDLHDVARLTTLMAKACPRGRARAARSDVPPGQAPVATQWSLPEFDHSCPIQPEIHPSFADDSLCHLPRAETTVSQRRPLPALISPTQILFGSMFPFIVRRAFLTMVTFRLGSMPTNLKDPILCGRATLASGTVLLRASATRSPFTAASFPLTLKMKAPVRPLLIVIVSTPISLRLMLSLALARASRYDTASLHTRNTPLQWSGHEAKKKQNAEEAPTNCGIKWATIRL